MKEYFTKKNIIIITSGVIVLLLLGVLYFAFQPKELEPSNEKNPGEVIGDESFYNPVSYIEAEDLYNGITQICDGVQIIENGEKVCRPHDSYKQKMIGYSYEGENVVLYINIVQIKDGKVFSLTGEELGVYDEGQMQTLLDLGTTYLYKYAKENDQFKLLRIEKMNRIE